MGGNRFRCRRDSGAGPDSGPFAFGGRHRSQDGSPRAWTAAMTQPAARQDGEGGFTLIETLVALARTGRVLSALANITAHWLPNWNRGLDRIQRSEMIGITVQRISDDLAAAQFVPAGSDDKKPLFIGTERSVIFVRTAIGPNASPGLDVVRLSETSDQGGLATVRTRATFRPMPPKTMRCETCVSIPKICLQRSG